MNRNRFSTSLPHHASRGFTLIELMIVVIIVAILSAIAIPSYQQHTVRSSRAAAQSFMLQIASQEEKYALDARNYTDKLDSTGLKLPIPSNVSAKYTIDIINVTPTTFTVRAVPTAAQKDPLCGTLTVNQSALKTPSTATCW